MESHHQVEVRGHIELRTTFIDGTTSRTVNIRYLIVNAPSSYNILLGRPALNRIGAISSMRHMKMKLPSLEGTMITIKSDQKEVKKCYGNEYSFCSVRLTWDVFVRDLNRET